MRAGHDEGFAGRAWGGLFQGQGQHEVAVNDFSFHSSFLPRKVRQCQTRVKCGTFNFTKQKHESGVIRQQIQTQRPPVASPKKGVNPCYGLTPFGSNFASQNTFEIKWMRLGVWTLLRLTEPRSASEHTPKSCVPKTANDVPRHDSMNSLLCGKCSA